MTYLEILGKVSEETGLPKNFINKVYKAYWKTIRTYIVSLPLKEDLTDEEFSKLKPNVNIPSLGKLNVTAERYRSMKNKNAIIEERKKNKDAKNKENQTHV